MDQFEYLVWQLPLMVRKFPVLPRMQALVKKPAWGLWRFEHLLYWLLL